MQRKKQKTVPVKQDWAVLEEKFNDLLTPILGYAEFLQIPIIGQTVPCPHKTMGERIKAMRWSDKNALERK